MHKCKELMTKDPVCCLPDDMALKVAQVMKRENIGPVPVIENEQTRKLVGIVTDRDLALKIVAEGRDANSTKVEAVMTRKVVTCLAEDELQKALDKMTDRRPADAYRLSLPGRRPALRACRLRRGAGCGGEGPVSHAGPSLEFREHR